jgi:hypothetical protein
LLTSKEQMYIFSTGNGSSSDAIPNLPQTQMRLFERIQQKQKENSPKEEKVPDNDSNITKDENWYSSDEEQQQHKEPVKPAEKTGRRKRWDVQTPLGQEENATNIVAETKPPPVTTIVLPKELTEVLSLIKKEIVPKELPVQPEIESADSKAKLPSRDPR